MPKSFAVLALGASRCLAGTVGAGPSDEAYFGGYAVGSGPPPYEPPRLSKVSLSEFARYAERGWPVIVTDVTAGWPMGEASWGSCESIGAQFPGNRMRREYTEGPEADDNNMPLGESDTWTSQQVASGADDAAAPQFAPFYWDVKDGAERGEHALLARIQKLTRVPYFMAASNLDEMQGSPEFWFSAAGAGAKAHMDSHCQSTMSVQLSGTKRWRISGIPSALEGPLENGAPGGGSSGSAGSSGSIFADGAVYKRAFVERYLGGKPWVPTFEFNLTAGEGLFFPPGFVHETQNVGAGCAASVTYQWDAPVAARYYRTFLRRIHRTGDLGECYGLVDDMATLAQATGAAAELRSGGSAAAAARVAAALDADADGELSAGELEQALRGSQLKGMIRIKPADAIAFHDLDGDGVATVAEFTEVAAAWAQDALAAGAASAAGAEGGEGGPEDQDGEEEEEVRGDDGDGDDRHEL